MVIVAALALAGGACGGDDDGDATDVTDVTDAAAASDASDTSSVDENSAADDADDADDVDTADDSGGGEWCEMARDLESNSPLDDVDSTDPDAIESAFEEMIDLTEQAADSAPDEIKDDVELVVAETKKLFDELRAVDFDFTALDESLLDNPEATAAGEAIAEYEQRVCGIETDSFDDTDVTVADDSGDDTGTTGGGDDDSGLDDGTTREQVITQLTEVGLTDDQATCIVDNIDDLEEFAQTGASDPTAFLNLIGTCEIDLTQLTPPAEPGG
jgi:hypothetical protein